MADQEVKRVGFPQPSGYCKHGKRLRLDECADCLTEIAKAEADDRRSRIDSVKSREELNELVEELYPHKLTDEPDV